MNKTGWRFFWSLLFADIVGSIASYLGLTGWNIWIMVAAAFVIFVIVLNVLALSNAKRKARKELQEEPQTTAVQNTTETE